MQRPEDSEVNARCNRRCHETQQRDAGPYNREHSPFYVKDRVLRRLEVPIILVNPFLNQRVSRWGEKKEDEINTSDSSNLNMPV